MLRYVTREIFDGAILVRADLAVPALHAWHREEGACPPSRMVGGEPAWSSGERQGTVEPRGPGDPPAAAPLRVGGGRRAGRRRRDDRLCAALGAPLARRSGRGRALGGLPL